MRVLATIAFSFAAGLFLVLLLPWSGWYLWAAAGLALAALGLDASTDARFVHGETTLLTALERFRQPDGSFAHALGDTEGNLLATAQAAQALAALAD